MQDYKDLGVAVRERREQLGLSRRNLMDQIEQVRDPKTIQSVELGQHRARIDVFLNIVQALGGEVAIVWNGEV